MRATFPTLCVMLLVLASLSASGMQTTPDPSRENTGVSVVIQASRPFDVSSPSRFDAAVTEVPSPEETAAEMVASTTPTYYRLLGAVDANADGNDDVLTQENGTLVARRGEDGSILWMRDEPTFVMEALPIERPARPALILVATESLIESREDKDCTGAQPGECQWHTLARIASEIRLRLGSDGEPVWTRRIEWTWEQEVRSSSDAFSTTWSYREQLRGVPDRILLAPHDIVVNGGALEIVFHERTERLGPVTTTSEGRSLLYEPRAEVISLATGETRFEVSASASSGGSALWPMANPQATSSDFLFVRADGRNTTVDCLSVTFVQHCGPDLERYSLTVTSFDESGRMRWHLPTLLPTHDAFAHPLLEDLDGDGTNDFAVVGNDYRAHSGATGLEIWRRDSAYTTPFVLGDVDGGKGTDLLEISLQDDASETPATWTRIGLTRVDGATGATLFETDWNRSVEPTEGGAIAFNLLDANGDAILDPILSWMQCQCGGNATPSGKTQTRLESGDTGQIIMLLEQDGFLTASRLGDVDAEPGDEILQAGKAFTPASEDVTFIIGARTHEHTLWSRATQIAGRGHARSFADLARSDGGTSILYSIATNYGQNIVMIDARTGQDIWIVDGLADP